MLESAQRSIVGVVTIWKEPIDPLSGLFAPYSAVSPDSGDQSHIPVVSFCTGWFEAADTIVTAGHCVDPKEGRLALGLNGPLQVDPETGMPAPLPPVRPDPERTVFVFQPRELEGRVITAPTEVRVHSFRSAEEGDTAKLEVHGLPAGHPLPIAEEAPLLGEPVTSIGFPGINISQTDGVELDALISGKNPAEVLQDSRLQPVSSSGTITARQFRHGSAVFQTNADVATGTSGGPTINARGEVLGVNSMMSISFTAQNFNIITDTGMMREFLGKESLPGDSNESAGDHDPPAFPTGPSADPLPNPPTKAPSEPQPMPAPALGGSVASPPTPTPMIENVPVGWLIGLPALGALAAIGISWLARRTRFRRAAGPSAGATDQPEPDAKIVPERTM
ncbi:trypsin-like serine peptidase [Pseudonocardia sp. CA-107938]|uniref:trypsin-like serine peptidase n=1 Tax=Pseudonocardia sp. CA-107938 TaxID=3240021 RepID=UPI003D90DA2D